MRREIAVLALAALALSCRREQRRFTEPESMSFGAAGVTIDEQAGLELAQPGTPGPYRGNAWAMSEGGNLYNQMNCVGCHAHGGGGMGPALADGQWSYGGDAASVFDSIVSGRPNGMPSYKGRLSDQQVWQIVAYVRSMSGQQPRDSAPGRDDHMMVTTPPSRMPRLAMTKQEVP